MDNPVAALSPYGFAAAALLYAALAVHLVRAGHLRRLPAAVDLPARAPAPATLLLASLGLLAAGVVSRRKLR